jgi:dienelactone hydrolase
MKSIRLLGIATLIAFSPVARADDSRLPGTKPLVWPEAELPDRVMDGGHRFVERKIREAAKNRDRFWPGADANPDQWKRMIEANRAHLRTIIGAVDERLPARLEYFGNTLDGALVWAGDTFRVAQVRWPVVGGVFGEGLLLSPDKPSAAAVVIPDADQTPEQLLGISEGIPADSQIARRLVANHVEVLIPTMISREKLQTEDARLKQSDQTHREWLYRQAFHMGRHVIGYEVQKVLAAIDCLEARASAGRKPPTNEVIGVAGYGEGALIAFYAAALDKRIDTTLVSGYFDSREAVWAEPIYRNVWGLLRRFGDAEIASLILPRKLIIEHSEVPTIKGHKGDWSTPSFKRMAQEVARIRTPSGAKRPTFVHGRDGATTGPYSAAATTTFLRHLGIDKPARTSKPLHDRRRGFSASERQRRAVAQIEEHVQGLVRKAEHVRDQFMLYHIMPELADARWSTRRRHPVHSPQKFIKGARAFRQRFYEQAIGRFDEPLLPFNARTRRVVETRAWVAYDVVLDVFDDLIAWGVLVIPKDLKPGEKRPVVVCQHGRQGIPRDTIDAHNPAYNDFAAKLAERGFITFAPHNLYRGEDRYRWLDRKANTIGCSLFSFIVAQHDQILRWLDSLDFVDGERIAFYGLSYGGETAVRVPPILEKYCLSICSGDFNQWTRKVAATDQPFSFMRTIEWEMPYWNLGNTFDYAEMTYLMVPRPFMVERGHLDRVGRDRWVAHEFAKVRWLYAQLGLSDRVRMEFFQGGHSINGEGTFAFLHQHLNWPASKRE